MELTTKLTQSLQRSVLQKAEQGREEKAAAQLLKEIAEIRQQIACNEKWFAAERDEDLVEACIYEGQALQARYRHLLRRARRERVCAPAAAFPEENARWG